MNHNIDLVVHRYLQVFFNLCLILLFLYLVLQFIFTVQRDVEQRISEYSMGSLLLEPLLFVLSLTPLQMLYKRSPCVHTTIRLTSVLLTPYRQSFNNAVIGKLACNGIQLSLGERRLVRNSSPKLSTVLWSQSVGKLW